MSPRSTTSPSARRRRAGRGRAGWARPRRHRRPGTRRSGALPSPKRCDVGDEVDDGRGPVDERPLERRLGDEVDVGARGSEPDPRRHVLDAATAAALLRAPERATAVPAARGERASRPRRAGHRTCARSPSRGRHRARRSRRRRGRPPRTRRRARAAAARATPRRPSATGCSVPTSWFASCTLTSVVSARTAPSTVDRVEAPAGRRRRPSRRPRPCHRVAHARVLDRRRHDVHPDYGREPPRSPRSPPRCPTT